MKYSLLLLLCLAMPASASLVFTLTPPVLTGLSGPGPLIFQGTLTDTDSDQSFLFLNDIAVTFTGAAGTWLSADPTGQPPSVPNTFFFNTVPGTLIGDGDPTDDFYSGPVFELFIAPNTPSGAYSGSIDILGGMNGPGDLNVLATQTFTVITPEPAALPLAITGMIFVAIGARRRKA